jgi:hypothetical protein
MIYKLEKSLHHHNVLVQHVCVVNIRTNDDDFLFLTCAHVINNRAQRAVAQSNIGQPISDKNVCAGGWISAACVLHKSVDQKTAATRIHKAFALCKPSLQLFLKRAHTAKWSHQLWATMTNLRQPIGRTVR